MRGLGAFILGWLLTLPVSGWAKSTIDARFDRTLVDLGGTVRLQVQVLTDLRDGDQPGQLAAPPLDDWDIIQQMQSQSFINSQSTQTVTLILRPKRTGRLTVGAFVLDADGRKQKTKPTTITVTGQAQAPAVPTPPPGPGIVDAGGGVSTTQLTQAPDRQAFLAWDVDKQSVYLGEQVFARLSLYVNRGLSVVDPNLRSFSTEGFWSEPMPQSRPEAEQVAIGRDLFIRNTVGHYRLFPLRAGEVRLPPVHADLVLGDRSLFGGRRSRQPRDAAPLTISVKALPVQGQPPGFTGPTVGRVTLEAMVDRPQVRAESGLQLTVTTSVMGLIGNVPEPRVFAPEWHVYPATNESQTQNRGRDVVGVRVSRMLLKPLKTGVLSLPALSIPYFDPATGTYGTASTQPISVEVIGTVNDPAAATPSSVPSGPPGAGPGQRPIASGSSPADEMLALREIRTRSDLTPARGPLWAHPLFPVAVVFPALLWLGLIGWQRWSEHVAAGAEGRAVRRAAADTRRAMEKLLEGPRPREAFAELSRLMVAFLELRLTLGLRGTVDEVLRGRLLQHGLPPELVAQIAQELETCDFSRFSPGDLSATELQDAVRRSTDLVARVDQHGGPS